MKAHRNCSSIMASSIGLVAWAYIFGSAFVANVGAASSSLSSATSLQRPDVPIVGTASGVATLRKTATTQEFLVELRGLPSESSIAGGLAVFLGSAAFDTNNFYFVNVLNGPGSNGTWRINLKATGTAPTQLGVADVADLVGRYIQICDVATNVFLQGLFPPLVPKLSDLSYRQRVQLQRPDPAPSPLATGVLTVKYDGKRGTSLIESRIKKLSGGNSYCSWIVAVTNTPTEDCPDPFLSLNGGAHFKNDTRTGEQLGSGAFTNGFVTVYDLIDYYVEIRDAFGVTHLRAVIPGPPP
jgi:hypothetical protein